MIGGIAETQDMREFCAEKKTAADVEIIPIQQINEANERMLRSDVKYRLSIDMASLAASNRESDGGSGGQALHSQPFCLVFRREGRTGGDL